MTVYWLLLLYFAVGAFFTSADWQRGSNIDPFFRFGAIAVVILIGFRYWIGGDWPQYERIFSFAGYASLPQVITAGDPGYQVLNWVTRRLGLEIWVVNLICGAIYATGLFKLARLQPNPWLAIAVAIPYLIIVVGMGYTRQSVALGLVMIGLAGLMRGSTAYRYVAYIILATLFHRSAVVMTLVLAAGHRTRFTNLLIGASVAYVLYDLIVSSAFPALSRNYLEAGYEAQGAAVRVFMNFMPAALFLLTPARFGTRNRDRPDHGHRGAGIPDPSVRRAVFRGGGPPRPLHQPVADDHPVAHSRRFDQGGLWQGHHPCLCRSRPVRVAQFRLSREGLGSLPVLVPGHLRPGLGELAAWSAMPSGRRECTLIPGSARANR